MNQTNCDFLFTPPNYLRLDVVQLRHENEKCQFCLENHVVVKIQEEMKSGGWTQPERMCAACASKYYEVEAEPSRFDK